jgi:hypothetical protein
MLYLFFNFFDITPDLIISLLIALTDVFFYKKESANFSDYSLILLKNLLKSFISFYFTYGTS